ncbi:hypothetical protein THAOC_36948, partial [Thalassiosira oceanica]
MLRLLRQATLLPTLSAAAARRFCINGDREVTGPVSLDEEYCRYSCQKRPLRCNRAVAGSSQHGASRRRTPNEIASNLPLLHKNARKIVLSFSLLKGAYNRILRFCELKPQAIRG